jgi:hypothetical protein
MNSKLIKASLAGVAAIGLAAGGGTFAAWSDFNLSGVNNAGAGTLSLTVNPNQPADIVFNPLKMAPGGINGVRNVYVASNDGDSTPSGQLFVSLVDLVGHEDGCDGGELGDDSNCADTAATNPGDFVDDATAQFSSYAVNSPGECTEGYAPASKVVTAVHGGSLASIGAWATPWELTGNGTSLGGVDRHYLAPGQGLCVSMSIGLASAVDNASQGDSADFKIRFDLKQAPYGTPTTPLTP